MQSSFTERHASDGTMSRVVRMLSRAFSSDERTELGLLLSATKKRSAVSSPGLGCSSR